MVKVFPSSLFGPKYLKEIKGPLNDIELLACGGVRPENMGEYFSCGASAVAFGGSIFSLDALSKGQFTSIEQNVKVLIDQYKRTG